MSTILDEQRQKIVIIDTKLLELLKDRMEISKEIASYKKEQGLPVFDPKREDELLLLYEKKVDFQVRDIFRAIMDESKRIQKNILA